VPWRFTDDVGIYAQHTWELLAVQPAQHTVALGIIESLRAGHRWSAAPPVFAWYADGPRVRGAVCMTPPMELVLAAVPQDTTAELVAALRAESVGVSGVNGAVADVERFAQAWVAGTALRPTTAFRQRLYVLGTLRAPQRPPGGRARQGTADDLEVALRWLRAFQAEVGVPATDVERWARSQIDGGRLWFWEDDEGSRVSVAARTAPAAGVARLAPVYTPPEHRRRGYGAAVTVACTADALDCGAEHVVLFTDLANPTSNAIYQQIGYRPLSDRRVVRFEPS